MLLPGLIICILSDPTTDFTVRVLPVLIPDAVEKKSYLILAPLLIIFFDGEISRDFQNLTVRLNLYFCKEWMLPLLSVLLGAFGLRVSFFSSSFFTVLLAFSFSPFFHIFAKVRCTPELSSSGSELSSSDSEQWAFLMASINLFDKAVLIS
jgi:hypothetical protein